MLFPLSCVIHVPTSQDTEIRLLQSMEQANAQQELSKSLLRLTYLLQHSRPLAESSFDPSH